MPDTGNTDVDSTTKVIDPLSPTSNEEFTQTSTLFTTDNGGLNEDEFCLSINLAGSNVADTINIALVIDKSGSTANNPETGEPPDAANPGTILEAQIEAAKALFDEYIAAGYTGEDVTISLIQYDGSASVVGSFDLSQQAAFNTAADGIGPPDGNTNFVAGLDAAGDAFTNSGASADDTNIVVFMSDGEPQPPNQDIAGAAEDLEDDWNAGINGIGIGSASDLTSLNILDNTGGAVQVNSAQELVDEIVQPLTETDFLRFEIVIEGEDSNGQIVEQKITLDESDPRVITTPAAIDVSLLPIDPIFAPGTDVTVTVTSFFAPDPGGSDPTLEQTIVTQHMLAIVVCFTPGTLILTPKGAVAVETLMAGDRVITRDHGVQPIRWIGSTSLSAAYAAANQRLRPILIRKGALGPNQPERDMHVSRQHRILVRGWRAEMLFGDPDGVLVPAFSLCNDSTIIEDRPTEDVTYIHIAFDRHEVVYADGVEAESFHPGARTVAGMNMEQRQELMALFPELADGQGFAYGAARDELRGQAGRVLSPKA